MPQISRSSFLNVDKFIFMNCLIFFFGLINVSLSISINSVGSIFIKDVSTSFLNLGLMLSLPSIGALILTFLALKGMKTGKKLLLIPIMVFLMVIPTMMGSLIFTSLVVQCKKLPPISFKAVLLYYVVLTSG